jgi:hypothetical protein
MSSLRIYSSIVSMELSVFEPISKEEFEDHIYTI